MEKLELKKLRSQVKQKNNKLHTIIIRRLKIVFLLLIIQAEVSYAQTNKAYPKFSWDKVPLVFHFRKHDTLLSLKEAKFISERSNFMVFEKAHGQLPGGAFTEQAILNDAKVLKKLNPDMKVIFYWNTLLDYPFYEASSVFNEHPEWWLKKSDGTIDFKRNSTLKKYDLSNKKLRKWWVKVVKKAVNNPHIDGVFMDAFNQVKAPFNLKNWGQEKFDAMNRGLDALVNETNAALDADKITIWNGIRSTRHRVVGNDYLESMGAVMIEHFGHFHSASPQSMLSDLELMDEAAKAGKIVVFKAWPGFTWLDKEQMALPLEDKQQIAKQHIEFPLAAFLIAAQEHSYFIYNWGYRMDFGSLEWYPELDKPLGKPLGDYEKNGFIFTRKYEHASIYLDLKETKNTKITWH